MSNDDTQFQKDMSETRMRKRIETQRAEINKLLTTIEELRLKLTLEKSYNKRNGINE